MAEKISIIASDFETQLTSAISVAGTSFTLQSITDNDGVDLADGMYCFTLDRDKSSKEYLIGQLDADTKTVSSVFSVSRQGSLTANAQRAHRIGANVIISDHSILSALSKIMRGEGTFDGGVPLSYDSNPTFSSSTEIVTKGYVDSVVTGGTINTDRIIIGSQDAGEVVSTGNIVFYDLGTDQWFLADADTLASYQNLILGVALGAGTAGNPISGGVQLYGKCDSFTGLADQELHYLSSTAGGVSTTPSGVIVGGAFSTTGIFINFRFDTPIGFVTTSAGAGDEGKGIKLNPSGKVDATAIPFSYGKALAFSSGLTTKNMADANTTQTIAHGLSVVPTRVRLSGSYVTGGDMGTFSGVFDASGQRGIGLYQKEGGTTAQDDIQLVSSENAAVLQTGSLTAYVLGTVSVDGTNISIAWDKTNSPTGTFQIMWEAEGLII